MRHLAGGPQSALLNPNEDYLDERGAHQIATRILAYWTARGARVGVWVEKQVQNSSTADGRVMYVVRSDMIGGGPRAIAA